MQPDDLKTSPTLQTFYLQNMDTKMPEGLVTEPAIGEGTSVIDLSREYDHSTAIYQAISLFIEIVAAR